MVGSLIKDEDPVPLRTSVVIPVVDEAALLARTLASIGADTKDVDVIVVDGGSEDESRAVASRYGAFVLPSPVRQRAAQMNLGAQHAQGSVLVFLHADTILPPSWLETVRRTLAARPACVGGAFRRRFDLPSAVLRATCRLADWRGRRFGLFLGDQAMFVRREVFVELGGFRLLRQFEDLEFSRRLMQRGATVLLEPVVLSSGRRFVRRGPVRQTLADLVLTWHFLRRPLSFLESPGAGFECSSGIRTGVDPSFRDTCPPKEPTTTSSP